MSYIGSNPSADDIRLSGTAGIRSAALLQLTVSATDPGTPAEGMVYYNDGTGTISEGLKVYKNGNFVSLDAQEGDADTLELKQAKDIPTIAFNAAVSSTDVVGNTFPVPKTTSTGTIVGTFDVPTTGTDALMSNADPARVFKYISSSTLDSQSDYFGIPLSIPKAFRGENIVLSYVYRTVTTSTTAMSDGQFKVYIQDKTNAVVATVASATGTIAAGTTIALSTGTASTMAVGDKVFVETGGGTAGADGNGITEAYLTYVSGDDIKLSATVVLPSTAGATIASKWLTDLTKSNIAVAESTVGAGKMKRIAFVPPTTCAEVYVWWQNTASTGSTKIDTLFFDQLLLSSNKFLQASSQGKAEALLLQTPIQSTGTSSQRVYYSTVLDATEYKGDLFTYDNDSTQGLKITFNQDVDATVLFGASGTGNQWMGIAKNYDVLSTGAYTIPTANVIAFGNTGGAVATELPFTGKFKVGDYLYFHCINNVTSGDRDRVCFSIIVTPQDNDVIILESQDEIFTDWVEYTPTITGSTNSGVDFRWRRIGSDMEIRAYYFIDVRSSTETVSFTLPTGYTINPDGLVDSRSSFGSWAYIDQGFYVTDSSRSGLLAWGGTSHNDKVFFAEKASSTAASWTFQVATAMWGDDNRTIIATAKIPIQGWNANFNPLLSMPLVDFTSWENTFTAKIDSTGTITSQGPTNWISTVGFSLGYLYTITYTSGLFTTTPNIMLTSHDGNSNVTVQTSTSTYNTVVSATSSTDAGQASAFYIQVTKNGADYVQPPQATAAVIKPSVAIVCNMQPAGTGGGAIAAGTSFTTLTLNTILGESWFLTANGTNNFTLEAGKYEFDITVPIVNTGVNGHFNIGLYDQTNSRFLSGSVTANTVMDVAGASGSSLNSFAVTTIASSTEYRLKASGYVAGTAGSSTGTGVGVTGIDNAFAQVKIRKLQ